MRSHSKGVRTPRALPLPTNLQVVDDDVTEHQVHLHVVEGLLVELQRRVAELQGPEVEVLRQLAMAQPVVQGGQPVVGHALVQPVPWGVG